MKYITGFLASLALFAGITLANENSNPRLDVSVEIVNSTNTGGSRGEIQYSVVLRNIGTESIDNVGLRIYSNDAKLRSISDPGRGFRFFDLNNEIGPFTLDSNQTLHFPFFAVVNEPGSIASIHAELSSSDDEIASNNKASVNLHTLEGHQASLMQNNVVAVEAEIFSLQKGSTLASTAEAGYQIPAWHLHAEEFLSTKQPDPDSSSPTEASGGAYVEALPDVRLNEFDLPVFGISNFDQSGRGPELSYTVYLDQPGRYYLFARIRATNEQDNTIHISFDNSDFATIEVCNPSSNWQWASQNASQCNSADSVYFDIENPGFHYLVMSMGDDGTEVDKILLQRDNSTKPLGLGPDPTVYQGPFVNLVMHFWPTDLNVTPGDSLTLYFEILENTGSGKKIENMVMNFDIDPVLLQSYTGFNYCENNDGKLQCSISDWPHFGPDFVDPGPFGITIGPLVTGELVVNAWVEADLLSPMLDEAFYTQTFVVKPGGVLLNAAANEKIESVGGGAFSSGLLALLSILRLTHSMIRRRKLNAI